MSSLKKVISRCRFSPSLKFCEAQLRLCVENGFEAYASPLAGHAVVLPAITCHHWRLFFMQELTFSTISKVLYHLLASLIDQNTQENMRNFTHRQCWTYQMLLQRIFRYRF